jgi:hypothetical protein
LAEGPAKLMKKFRRNFEWHSNSAGMVPGITWTELCRNGIRRRCRVLNDVQIEHQCLPMLDLDIINKQTLCSSATTTTIDDRTHRHLLTTVISPPPSCHHHHQRLAVSGHIHRPQPAHQHTTNYVATPCRSRHVTYRTSAGHVDTTQRQRGVKGAN